MVIRHPALSVACLSAEAAAVFGVVLCDIAPVATRAADADAPPPEWIKIAPLGVTRTRDGRAFSFDAAALIQTFNAEGVNLPIDVGHATERRDFAAPAIGWVTHLEARPDGIYARCDWLEGGVAVVRARTHRYVSPAFTHTTAGAATRFTSVGLVTTPALGGMSAVASLTGDATMLKSILTALGLTEAATEQEALAALAARPASATADMVPATQLAAVNAELATARAELAKRDAAAETARCEALVDGAVAAGKVAPAARDHYLALARANYAACDAALTAMPAVLKAGADPKAEADPVAPVAGRLTDQQRDIAARCGLSEEQFLKSAA